ncbi:hypothetical protein EV363DRAFT_159946 [Boletus edulis]|nr:hypothetical protein EV363DRAFT_159946 [Boletus edulis]
MALFSESRMRNTIARHHSRSPFLTHPPPLFFFLAISPSWLLPKSTRWCERWLHPPDRGVRTLAPPRSIDRSGKTVTSRPAAKPTDPPPSPFLSRPVLNHWTCGRHGNPVVDPINRDLMWLQNDVIRRVEEEARETCLTCARHLYHCADCFLRPSINRGPSHLLPLHRHISTHSPSPWVSPRSPVTRCARANPRVYP